MYSDIFKNHNYPGLLNSIDALKLSTLPPWEFINDNYTFWKSEFNKANLFEYAPFARMINDDVIATLNLKKDSEEISLFILPISSTSKPFKKFDSINSWLKLVLEDCYEYLIEY